MNINIFPARADNSHIHPSAFMFLFLPFGIMGGYVSVTIGYLLTSAHIPLEQVAPIVAVSLLPNIFKFLWAPLIDTTLTVKKWYVISNVITAAGIIITGILPLKTEYLGLMGGIILAASFANTFLAMSTESLMAHGTPDNLKGRAAGWLQTGNLGGVGLGGGAGIWLYEKLPGSWLPGALIGVACLLSSFALFYFPEPQTNIRDKNYLRTIVNLNKDIWSVMKSRKGALGLLLCLMPIGSGAASNLWSSVSNDWKASADTVALIVGVAGGILAAAGCLMGGWLCDRMDRKRAYVIFGLIQAFCAIGMGLSPRTELMFTLWTSLYAVTTGLVYAGFSAFTLEAIGKGAAATKYNVFASFSNAPLYLMIYIDEWSHVKWGAGGMLNSEAATAIIGMLIFTSVFFVVKRRPALAQA